MESRQLGDYRLLQPLAQHPGQTTWFAEQSSIGRNVVLVELTDLRQRESFLADVRAKAAVDHPLIGSVYEASSGENECFVALEHLSSASLADRLRTREALKPAALAHVLRRTAEAMLQLSAHGVRTEPLTPAAIHLDVHGVIRIENIARAGTHEPAEALADIQRLGQALPGLVADGMPGASRVLTVLAWMRGEGVTEPLQWDQVRSYGEQIEAQLLEAEPTANSPRTAPAIRKKSKAPVIAISLGALALILVAVFALWPSGEQPAPPSASALPEPVAVPAGAHPTPDGGTENLAAFRISAHEVTIGEYLEFLEVLAQLPADERNVFDAESQPPAKTDHFPTDWDAMLSAARDGGNWNGAPISLQHPVVNIDWFDATAYCTWKGARLPTQEEWFAALRQKLEKPETLQPASWGPVHTDSMVDRTPAGMRGMAGSVSEWTRRAATNPANPIGGKEFVIIGASWKNPGGGALARAWTRDRLQRRPDLGFRVVLPAS
ncbi:MAG: SUMF1/EgtB/PvdO family nonheme iron enzyme [Akkermansiaceae bacterium]|nr:SUMF1/EgtB/PvdO family nonheme iron enzyme [Akkermansiaceae bacterium]